MRSERALCVRVGVVVAVGVLLTIGVLGGAAWRIEKTLTRRTLLGIAIFFWGVTCLAFAALLAMEHPDVSRLASISCPIAGTDSEFAPSHWSNFPPGEVCEYADGDVRPSYGRVVLAIGLIGLPVAAIVAWPRRTTAKHLELAGSA